jgi:N-acetyl-anhydromuramyl-L-alanine amidase AmpD
MKRTRALFAAMAALCLSSCTTSPSDDSVDLEGEFSAAAREYNVPVDLLKAVSYVETRWEPVVGEADFDRAAGVGVFGLAGENLTRGAAAAGLDEETVKTDTHANIEAGAARLAELAAARGISGDDLMAWAPVLEDFAQVDDADARAAYVSDVQTVLAGGASVTEESGRIRAAIDAHRDMRMPEPPTVIAATNTDYANAIFRSSPNYNSRNGSAVTLVVIHSCEGGYSGCWGYLRTSAAQASAHYVVKENGGEITQLVREANRAWHVAASYNCAYAGNAQCNKNGVSVNNFSVGIEHAGYASQASWSSGIIESSAKLTCDITKRHGVVRDRNHIVSHGQLQPYNRTDPGPNWPWAHYIDRVRANCGDGGGGGGGGGGGASIIIDSNNANNNANVAKIELTGTWQATTGTPGYYGSGYYFANTAATSAPATFWFYLPAAATKSIDAWWTAGSNRASAAPFVAFNAAGTEVGRRSVNQRVNGSTWVNIGTYNFSAGWSKVVLSRWTTSGDVVIADAVRVR